MTDIERQPDAEGEYQEHLERSATVWDRWSDWYSMSEQDFEPIREDLIEHLGLERGDRVLEIGCGPGVNFAPVLDKIGDEGQLVAIDYSPEMIAKANARVDENGWENVDIRRADATTADLGTGYDAALATLSMSVMPDVERTVRNVHDALIRDAPLGILDLQGFQSGPLRLGNPLLRRFLRWYANWNVDGDVRAAVDDVFGGYELLETHMLGTVYTLTARRTIRQSTDSCL